jgi:hypothetical protein
MHDHRLISLQNRAAFTMMKQGHTPRMWVPLSLGRERGRETICRHCGLTGRVWSQRVDQVEGEVFAEACAQNTGFKSRPRCSFDDGTPAGTVRWSVRSGPIFADLRRGSVMYGCTLSQRVALQDVPSAVRISVQDRRRDG